MALYDHKIATEAFEFQHAFLNITLEPVELLIDSDVNNILIDMVPSKITLGASAHNIVIDNSPYEISIGHQLANIGIT